MALVVKDRVKETTTTTGTGTITLAGAADGYQSFAAIGNGNTTYYAIVGDGEWEVGIGTYTSSGTTLSRTTVLESSNSGSLVSFSSGEKQVFCTFPAEKMITVDNDGSGSGLDADKLDGYHASSFALSNHNHDATYAPISHSHSYLPLSGGSLTGALDFNTVTGRAITITADTALDSADASIYLGNAPSSYGFDITYEGTGGGNTNAFVITSTNAGSPKELIRANQDGIVKLVQSGATVAGNTIFHDGYHPNADKWTTARTHTVTLTGDVTGSASQTVDGSGNRTWSITTAVANDSHTHNKLIAVDDRDMKPSTSGITGSTQAIRSFFSTKEGMTGNAGTNYHDVLVLDTYSDSTGGGPNAISFDKGNSVGNPEAYLWKGAWEGTTWGTGQRIFADNYHPNADKWTTARTLSLTGDVTGSVSLDGSADASITATVANDSHSHSNYMINNGNTSTTGYIQAEGFVGTGGTGTHILAPHGAHYATTTSSVTGAIKITLPQSWTNTMLRFTVKVYEYTTGESFEIVCAGYNYSGSNTWINTSAYILSDPHNNRNFTVRFGHDGTKCCVYIGETNSTWSYPQVAVTEFYAGYSNYSAETWNDNWAVGFATSFGTINQTHTNNEIGRYVDGNVVWHAGNDGSGSGLDADSVDGTQLYAITHSGDIVSLSGDVTGSTTVAADGAISITTTVNDDSHNHSSSSGDFTVGGTLTVNSNLFPNQDGTGYIGDASHTWYGGQFTNLTVDSTLNVRAYIDLADSDGIRFGSSDDSRFWYNGSTNNFQVEMESACLGYQWTDNGTEVMYLEKSTGNLTLTGTVDGRDVAADGTKLDGIEAGATADQTASEILTAIKTVDGSGSGLDADTLDGIQASSFVRSDAADTITGRIVFKDFPTVSLAGYGGIEYWNEGFMWEGYVGTENNSGNLRYNSRQGTHTWYANSVSKMSLNSSGDLAVSGAVTANGIDTRAHSMVMANFFG